MASSTVGPGYFSALRPKAGPNKELFDRSWAVDVSDADSTRAELLEQQPGGLPPHRNTARLPEERAAALQQLLDEQGAPIDGHSDQRPSLQHRTERLQHSSGEYSAVLALVELSDPSSHDDSESEGERMLTVLGLPVMGAVEALPVQDLEELPGVDPGDLQALQYETGNREDKCLYPLLATVVRDTRAGSVAAAAKVMENSLHSTVLLPQALDALVPTLIPSTSIPADDSPESNIWLSIDEAAAYAESNTQHKVAIHEPKGSQRGIKGFLYASSVAWLPKDHSLPLGFAMDPASIRSGKALKAALVQYFGEDVGQWDYLTATTYYDAVLGAMADKPASFALPIYSLQQIATTWRAAVYPRNKSKVPTSIQFTWAHMMCKLQVLAFRDRLHATITNTNALRALTKYESIGTAIVKATDDSDAAEADSEPQILAGQSDITYVYGKVLPGTKSWDTAHGFEALRNALSMPAFMDEYEAVRAPTSKEIAERQATRLPRKDGEPVEDEEVTAEEESDAHTALSRLFASNLQSPKSTAQQSSRRTAPAPPAPDPKTPQPGPRTTASSATTAEEDSKPAAGRKRADKEVQFEKTVKPPAPSPFEPTFASPSTDDEKEPGEWLLAMDMVPGIRAQLGKMLLKQYMPETAPSSRSAPVITAQALVVTQEVAFTNKELLTSHILAHVVPLRALPSVVAFNDGRSIAKSICLQPGIIGGPYLKNVMNAADKSEGASDIFEFMTDQLNILMNHNCWPANFAINSNCLRNPRMIKALRQGAWVVGDTIATVTDLERGLSPGHMIATVNMFEASEAKSDNIYRLPLRGFRAEQIIQLLGNATAIMHVMTMDEALYPHLPSVIANLASPLYLRSPVVGAIYAIIDHLRQPNIMTAINKLYDKHGTVEIVALLITALVRLFSKIRAWAATRRDSHYIKVTPSYAPLRDDCTLLFSKYQDGSRDTLALDHTIAEWATELKAELSPTKLQKMLDAPAPVAYHLLQLPPVFHPPAAPKTAPPEKKRPAQQGEEKNPKASKEPKKEGDKAKSRTDLEAELATRECTHAREILIKFNPSFTPQDGKGLGQALGKARRLHNVPLAQINNKQVCFPWLMECGCPGKYIKSIGRRAPCTLETCGGTGPRLHVTTFTKEALQPLWDFLQNEHIRPTLQPTEKFTEIMR